MPRLLEEVEVNLEHVDLANRQILPRQRGVPPRQAGMHLSGVLKYVVLSSRMPGWQNYEKELAPAHYPLIWFLGVAWEEAVASLYPEWQWQPGECSWAGVSMNCDGLSLLPEGFCVEEAKYTSCKRKSGKELLQDWLKMQQGRGYCGGYGPRLVRWHFLWNYHPYAPVYVRYLVEFTDDDVESTRRMVESNLAGAIAAGYEE